MPQPLQPLGGYLDVGEVGDAGVVDYSTHPVLVRGERVAEFPEGVLVEVEALEGFVSLGWKERGSGKGGIWRVLGYEEEGRGKRRGRGE